MSKWKKSWGKELRWVKRQLIKRDGSVCALCLQSFASMKEITLDHIIPRSQGGNDLIENLQLAHLHCNQDKGSMMPDEYELWSGAAA